MICTYIYKTLAGDHLIPGKCLAEIVKADKSTYLIKLLQYCKNYPLNKIIRVNKKNIVF
jgi:hypothetical protein